LNAFRNYLQLAPQPFFDVGHHFSARSARASVASPRVQVERTALCAIWRIAAISATSRTR
jgi:hypothetical protein